MYHVIEHVIALVFVFLNRILLTICLKSNTLTELIHIIDMLHPVSVDTSKKKHTLCLTDSFRIREFSFLFFIEVGNLFLYLLEKLCLCTILSHVFTKIKWWQWNDRFEHIIKLSKIPFIRCLIITDYLIYTLFSDVIEILINNITH